MSSKRRSLPLILISVFLFFGLASVAIWLHSERSRAAGDAGGALEEAESKVIAGASVADKAGADKAAPAPLKLRVSPRTVEAAQADLKAAEAQGSFLCARVVIENDLPCTLAAFLGHDPSKGFHVQVLMHSEEHSWQHDLMANEDGRVYQPVQKQELPLTEKEELVAGKWTLSLVRESFDDGPSIYEPLREIDVAAPAWNGRLLDFGEIKIKASQSLYDGHVLATGRLVHKLGVPVASTYISFSYELFNGDNHYEDVQTDESGWFVTSIYVEPAQPLEDLVSRARILPPGYHEDDVLELPKPKVVGAGLDFGTITITTAVLQISVSGWLSNKQLNEYGVTDADLKLEGEPSLCFNIWNSEHSNECSLPRNSGDKFMFVPAEPFRWHADVLSSSIAYEANEGSIEPRLDAITVIEIKLAPLRDQLLLHVTTPEGPPALCQVTLNLRGNESEQSGTYSMTNGVGSFHWPPDHSLTVTAKAEGYAQVSKEAPAGTRTLLIELTERAAPTTGTMIIEPPDAPPGYERMFDNVQISCVRSGKQYSLQFNSRDGKAASVAQTMVPGDYTLTLIDASNLLGYSRGIVAGPVLATVVAGQTTTVTFPALAKPRWETPARAVYSRVTCAGQPVSMTAKVRSELSRLEWVTLNHGSNVGPCPLPLVLEDGEMGVDIPLGDPDENGMAWFCADLECRLEVRLVRRGKPFVAEYYASCTMEIGGGQSSSSSRGFEGKAYLWMPAGKAQLSVSGQSFANIAKEVEIQKGKRAVVEFEIDNSYLTITWAEEYHEGRGATWIVCDNAGHFAAAIMVGVYSLKLKPGAYKVWPFATGTPVLEFTLGEHAEAALTIPYVAEPDTSGTLLMPLPPGFQRSPDGYHSQLIVFPAHFKDYASAAQITEFGYGWSCQMRVVADGVKITGLPVGVEVYLYASLAHLPKENDEGVEIQPGWCVGPFKVKAGAQASRVSANWTAAAKLGQSWHGYAYKWYLAGSELAFYISPPEGMTQYLPPGDYRVVLEYPKKTLERNFKLSAQDPPLEIPEDMAKELEAIGD